MSCLPDPADADPSDRKGIIIMTNQRQVVGGVDSHKDTIHVAVVTAVGPTRGRSGVPDHDGRVTQGGPVAN